MAKDPLCVGNYYTATGIYPALGDADATLAIGTKFAVGVGGQQAALVPPGDLIQIDIDPGMIGRTHRAAIGVHADAALALRAIQGSLGDFEPNQADWNQKVWVARDGVRQAMRKRLGDDWPRLMDKLRDALPRDGIFVRDQTISAYNWGNQLFPIYEPRSSLNPTSGAIGPGFPMAIGAAIATGRRTLVVHGDGGFLYHATELATAAQYQVPVLVCVCNDQGYGVLRWLQHTRFGRINETDLGKVDFAKLAESLGVPGERVASVDAFCQAVDRGMAVCGPYLIDIDMEHLAPMAISMMPRRDPPGHPA
jgi:acetolactate synthase-1/2/3 large subunit